MPLIDQPLSEHDPYGDQHYHAMFSYFDQRYRMVAAVLYAYIAYGDDGAQYNHVADELAAELDHLAHILNYENHEQMRARIDREDATGGQDPINVILNADIHDNRVSPITPEQLEDLIRSLYELDDNAPLDNPPI